MGGPMYLERVLELTGTTVVDNVRDSPLSLKSKPYFLIVILLLPSAAPHVKNLLTISSQNSAAFPVILAEQLWCFLLRQIAGKQLRKRTTLVSLCSCAILLPLSNGRRNNIYEHLTFVLSSPSSISYFISRSTIASYLCNLRSVKKEK
ncbi:hypothetical protein ACP275_10G129300 [Erythranthe tilingii]